MIRGIIVPQVSEIELGVHPRRGLTLEDRPFGEARACRARDLRRASSTAHFRAPDPSSGALPARRSALSQAPYIIPSHLARADPLMERFERWCRDRLGKGFSLQDAASDLATTTRPLQHRCQAVLGKSPLAYFQDLRVEHARNLIQDGSLGLDAIAARVGYVDGATLRSLLRDRLGRGVRKLRCELS